MPRSSIRRRVPMLILLLLLGVVATYAGAAYQAVREAVIADARGRLGDSGARVAARLAEQTTEMHDHVQGIAESAVARELVRGVARGTAALRAMLADPRGSDSHLVTELVDGSGRVLYAAPDTVSPDDVALAAELPGGAVRPAGSGVGQIRVVNGRLLYPVAAPILDQGRPIGHVVRWQRLSTSPEARELIQDLIGRGTHLYLGNRAGGLWTDLSKPVDGPPPGVVSQGGAVEYDRPDSGVMLGAMLEVPGTAWRVLLESPRANALAPARATLYQLLVIGALVLLLGTGLAWVLSWRLTRDVTQLAGAAVSISRGDYGRRVDLGRTDEIGALGEAFNTMSAAVAEARLALERKVAQLARTEEEHRATRERLQHVTASSPAILYEARLEAGGLQLEWISANVREGLGYTVEEAKREGWWKDHLHPEDRELLMGTDAPSVPREDRTREYRFRHGDGHYCWILDEQRVLRDGGGQIIEIVGALSDISDRRQLEEQFRMSQKLEAVGRLAGGVAHDFNNLLTVILGEVSGAEEAAERGDDSAEALAHIDAAARRAADLTRQLLTFSRQSVVETTAFDANLVVRELHSMLERVIGEDVALELELDESIGAIVADRGQVEQVLMNLVVNARDATPAGGTISIETRQVHLDQDPAHGQPAGAFIELAVRDTGTGMSEEIQAHLFEPFFTTKEPGKGSGLGLATCYAIVDRFGGHMAVDSEPRVGSTVRVRLPKAEGAADPLPAVRSEGLPRGRETVLVVEDDQAVRSVTIRMLTAQGYHVLEAIDGEAALEVMDAHGDAVDLVLTDVVMPRMGGRTLAERVRRRYPDMPILFASGYSDEFMFQNQVFDDGMALVQKPFTRGVLARKVRAALDRR